MKTSIFTLLALLLAACAPEQAVKKAVVTVRIPCLTSSPERPEFPLQNAVSGLDLYTLSKMALAEIEIRKGYESKLEASITGCIKSSETK